ncbi:MAG: epoxyqueuosine reductase QueH [Lachnospiraceae bacterium]|nr:epoxyqueuosine reductase QueH [Lachnospiraceae bacterium]
MPETKRNYDAEMEEALVKGASSSSVPTLLLHVCCAPCSSAVLERLSPYFRITVLFFNPNIFPETEYRKRAAELRRFVSETSFPNPVDVLEGPYEPFAFFELVKGLEKEPEGGARCEVCFRMRLHEAVWYAKEEGFDYVTTTLTISPQKNVELLNRIGEEEAAEAGVKWLPSAFRKKGGYQRSIELSKEHGLYRQDFCGCVFSKEAREREKRAEEE